MAGYDMPNAAKEISTAGYNMPNAAKETSMTVYNMPNTAKETLAWQATICQTQQTGLWYGSLRSAKRSKGDSGMTGYDLPNAAKKTITLPHASVGCTSGGVYAPCIYTHAM